VGAGHPLPPGSECRVAIRAECCGESERERGETTLSRGIGSNATGPITLRRRDKRLSVEEQVDLFEGFGTEAAEFSRRIIGMGLLGENGTSRIADLNVEIAKEIFAKWCIEIYVRLHDHGPLGFGQLRRELGPISTQVLSLKLKNMETWGLVSRTQTASRPPGSLYALTKRGLTMTKIGEPVFLYLALTRHLDSVGHNRMNPDDSHQQEQEGDRKSHRPPIHVLESVRDNLALKSENRRLLSR
jgi:DNA-binding HxlR family transcriptional regulator